jgi:tRNA pseudouridine38-40 synthase
VTDQQDMNEPAVPAPGDGGLVRLRLDLAYDGTDFSGWARQPDRRTVQQTIEDAISTVLRLSVPVALTVAGRTDAGVHAAGQVAHVDLAAPVDVEQLQRRLSGLLPADVVARSIRVAPPGFDARFAATGRRYRYRVADRDPDPLRRHDTVAWKRELDASAMHDAAQGLVGMNDFAAYCKQREGATTIRVLGELSVTRDAAGVVVVDVAADAFCHNQVRSMVGALLAVGDGRRPTTWPAEVLQAGVRNSAVVVAPPHGLTLVEIRYPPDDQLAARSVTTRARRTAL